MYHFPLGTVIKHEANADMTVMLCLARYWLMVNAIQGQHSKRAACIWSNRGNMRSALPKIFLVGEEPKRESRAIPTSSSCGSLLGVQRVTNRNSERPLAWTMVEYGCPFGLYESVEGASHRLQLNDITGYIRCELGKTRASRTGGLGDLRSHHAYQLFQGSRWEMRI